MLSSRGICDLPIPRPGESYRVCVCVCVYVSLSVTRCKNNPPYLHRVGRRFHTKKERKKQTNSLANKESYTYMCVWFLPCLLHVPPISWHLIQPQIMSKFWQIFMIFSTVIMHFPSKLTSSAYAKF